MLVTILRLAPTIECPQSLNSCSGGSECYTAMNCIVLFLNRVLRCQSLLSDLVYNLTNMHAMTYRSDFCTCSCRGNIEDPAVCFAVWLLSAVFRVCSPSFLIPNAMLESKFLNTSWFEVMITSKDKSVFIRDLSDLTLQIIFDAWWASINVGWKWPILWNNTRQAPTWRLYFHCGIDETGSPGIICIVCHQVLSHPSELGTSSMGKNMLAKAHIAKLNELT